MIDAEKETWNIKIYFMIQTNLHVFHCATPLSQKFGEHDFQVCGSKFGLSPGSAGKRVVVGMKRFQVWLQVT